MTAPLLPPLAQRSGTTEPATGATLGPALDADAANRARPRPGGRGGRAVARHEAGHQALSAGTQPADHVHPHVLEAMCEIGIELSDRIPRALDTDLAQWADVVVTMGCGDQCPYIPGKTYLDWTLPDAANLPIEQVRQLRDDIDQRVKQLVAQLDNTPGAAP